MLDDVRSSLAELGLSEKERDVYLAMLELGSVGIQDIARKARVNRSTTYLMMGVLMRKGLASNFERGKKLLFRAEDPDRLRALAEDELAQVTIKRSRLEQVLPRMWAVYNSLRDKPSVRFFEGVDAVHRLCQELIDHRSPVCELCDTERLSDAGVGMICDRLESCADGSCHRVLLTKKVGDEMPTTDRSGREVRVTSDQTGIFFGTVLLCRDRLYVLTSGPRSVGLALESRELTSVMQMLFENTWSSAHPVAPVSSS